MKHHLPLLFGCLFLMVFTGMRPAPEPEPIKHKFHVSYGRMAVEKNVAICRIRFFKHDLEEALQAYHKKADFRLEVNPQVDSLYTAYFTAHFKLETEEGALQGAIAGSGEETMGQDEMWWYIMQFEADEPITAFNLKNTLLLDLFDDQKNVFKIQHFPSEKSLSYYFAEGAEEYAIDLK